MVKQQEVERKVESMEMMVSVELGKVVVVWNMMVAEDVRMTIESMNQEETGKRDLGVMDGVLANE